MEELLMKVTRNNFWKEHNANITEEFEYDIVDEYENGVETMQMPVNYKVVSDEEKVYIISVNTNGLEQHKKYRQF